MTLHNSLTSQTAPSRFQLHAPTHLATVLRVILMLLLNVAMLLALALPIYAYVNPAKPVGPETPWFAWAIMFLWQPIMALQGVIFYRWVDRRPLAGFPLRFDGLARRAALWGTVLTVALMAAYVGLTQVAGVADWHWNAGFVPSAMILSALLTASAGFGEEFLFRGYLMRTLAHYGPRASALISSVIFALVHAITGRVHPLDQFALFLHGYFFAVLAQRTKSLWPGVTLHFVFNLLTSLVWTGSDTNALLDFDGSLGWTKWAFKAAMALPYLLLIRSLAKSRTEAR